MCVRHIARPVGERIVVGNFANVRRIRADRLAVVAVQMIGVRLIVVGIWCVAAVVHIVPRCRAADAVALTCMMRLSIIVARCSVVIVHGIVARRIDVIVIVNLCALCKWSCIIVILIVIRCSLSDL